MPEDLLLYGYDATHYRGSPMAVVMAASTEDVLRTVAFACKEGFKITPRGAGTGLSGGSVPIEGGIVLSCERMNSILKVDADNRFVIVQPGVVTSMVQEAAYRHNLFYPPDPSSNSVSTIGGNVAENAGGLRCFKYGVTGHYVLGIEFVDATGKLRHTGALSESDDVPDLTPLLFGSEGTLGIFTRIALRLIDVPEETVTIIAYFNDRMDAFSIIDQIIQSGYLPSVLEYIDHQALVAAARHIGIDYPDETEAMLLIELDGTEDEVSTALKSVRDLIKEKTTDFSIAADDGDRQRLWQLRRGISPSLIRIASGKIHVDIAAPRGRLVDMVHNIKGIEARYGIDIPFYGHAGDGNLHVIVMYNDKEKDALHIAEQAAREIYRMAVELGGTISGEHGIGCAKHQYLSWQHSEVILNLSEQVKHVLDPENLLNPGKIFSANRSLNQSIDD